MLNDIFFFANQPPWLPKWFQGYIFLRQNVHFINIERFYHFPSRGTGSTIYSLQHRKLFRFACVGQYCEHLSSSARMVNPMKTTNLNFDSFWIIISNNSQRLQSSIVQIFNILSKYSTYNSDINIVKVGKGQSSNLI